MRAGTEAVLCVEDAQQFLRWYLRYLCDEKFAPFLVADKEERIWHAAHSPSRVVDQLIEEELTDTEAAMLRFLARRAGGWFLGDGSMSADLQFVPLSRWRHFVKATTYSRT